jgi:hypothetical protein
MSDRPFDVVVSAPIPDRNDPSKTRNIYTRIGTAWPNRSGNGGFRVILNAMPFTKTDQHGNTQVELLLMPPREDTSFP